MIQVWMWVAREFQDRDDKGSPWLAVKIPEVVWPSWKGWLQSQDANLRRYIPKARIWLLHPTLKGAFYARCIQVDWLIEYSRPGFTEIQNAAEEEAIKSATSSTENSNGNSSESSNGGNHFHDYGNGESQAAILREASILECYKTMYILPNAPKEIIDAAYKALMKITHTDKGGDEEYAKAVNIAKDTIYKARGW